MKTFFKKLLNKLGEMNILLFFFIPTSIGYFIRGNIDRGIITLILCYMVVILDELRNLKKLNKTKIETE